MAEFVIDADGHIMEDHKDIFAHIKGNFSEMDWHSTWPMFDADGWQRGLARKGKREDPDAEAWIRFQNEHGIDCGPLSDFCAGVGNDPTARLGVDDRARLQRLALRPLHQPIASPQGCCPARAARSGGRGCRIAPLRQRTRLLCCTFAIRDEQPNTALRLARVPRNLRRSPATRRAAHHPRRR